MHICGWRPIMYLNIRDWSMSETTCRDCLPIILVLNYHAPGMSSYGATQIDESKRQWWFCSESDAIVAGRRAPRRQKTAAGCRTAFKFCKGAPGRRPVGFLPPRDCFFPLFVSTTFPQPCRPRFVTYMSDIRRIASKCSIPLACFCLVRAMLPRIE